ncbi:hypothetical protein GP2_054_00010 [Gordonia paraffinivorans NBRC 108238]|uniref:Uncharacterized protein n=1 Tax=Gordonia paraffinivorans NBRC 108238 TaxID=1223543 RepID=A0ABQ0IRF9_9ACTN|nr:DUF2742 domain-containing protein [Gordonia paraffinivorans]GAC86095.1 hypothetical protein GP2_054_00010 [Gordonia paraffinivorans NBRC 108238]
MTLSYTEALDLRYRLAGIELPETVDRAQLNALLTAGVRAVLEQELDALEDRRRAPKDAALAISQACDWKAVAKRVRDRDEAIKSGKYIERVSA